MKNTAPMIYACGLTCRFGTHVAVDQLDLEVAPGEVFGFLGHNGAGKTTTVRLLNGLLRPCEGEMRVLDLDPLTQGPALRRRTGVLTETPALEELLTARDNLHIYAGLYGVPRSEVASRTQRLLDLLDLSDSADHPVRGYSKGMKQRLALARALLHEPDLLFLDEPTEALDPLAAHHVRQLIHHLSHEEKRTIFLCTHNLTEAQELCDRVAILEHGRVLALGEPTTLLRRLAENMLLRLEIEIGPSLLSPTLAVLQSFPGIHACSRGDKHVTVSGASYELIPVLIEKLVAAGIPIYRVVPHEPTMEDFYFSIHNGKEMLL